VKCLRLGCTWTDVNKTVFKVIVLLTETLGPRALVSGKSANRQVSLRELIETSAILIFLFHKKPCLFSRESGLLSTTTVWNAAVLRHDTTGKLARVLKNATTAL